MTFDDGLENHPRPPEHCSIGRTLRVVGTRSAMQLLREAYFGTTRFDDFAERVGITPAVAAIQLKELVAAGILGKRPYREPGQRTRYEYLLTQRGHDLLPAVLALRQWGDAYLQDDAPPITLADADGNLLRVAVLNERSQELDLEELHVRRGARRARREHRESA